MWVLKSLPTTPPRSVLLVSWARGPSVGSCGDGAWPRPGTSVAGGGSKPDPRWPPAGGTDSRGTLAERDPCSPTMGRAVGSTDLVRHHVSVGTKAETGLAESMQVRKNAGRRCCCVLRGARCHHVLQGAGCPALTWSLHRALSGALVSRVFGLEMCAETCLHVWTASSGSILFGTQRPRWGRSEGVGSEPGSSGLGLRDLAPGGLSLPHQPSELCHCSCHGVPSRLKGWTASVMQAWQAGSALPYKV